MRAVPGRSRGFCDAAVEAFKVLTRIVKAVRMVDAQAIHFAFRHELKNQAVGCLKDGFIFHANSRQIVGIEKAPVVDVIGGDPPVGEAESLAL